MTKSDKHICFSCKHYRPFSFGCDAFQEGIPLEISENGDMHSFPIEGQNNDIVYEKGLPLEEALNPNFL